MVTNEQNKEIKFVSEAQANLYSKLLQSSCYTKLEREKLLNAISGKLTTSYDASLLISKLLMDIKFHKYFVGDRKKKLACCSACNTKINVRRFVNIADHSRIWICDICKGNLSKVYIPTYKSPKLAAELAIARDSFESKKPYFPSEDVKTFADAEEERFEEAADAIDVANYNADERFEKTALKISQAVESKNGN